MARPPKSSVSIKVELREPPFVPTYLDQFVAALDEVRAEGSGQWFRVAHWAESKSMAWNRAKVLRAMPTMASLELLSTREDGGSSLYARVNQREAPPRAHLVDGRGVGGGNHLGWRGRGQPPDGR